MESQVRHRCLILIKSFRSPRIRHAREAVINASEGQAVVTASYPQSDLSDSDVSLDAFP